MYSDEHFSDKDDFGSDDEVYSVSIGYVGLGKDDGEQYAEKLFTLKESVVDRLEDEWKGVYYFDINDDSQKKPMSYEKITEILERGSFEAEAVYIKGKMEGRNKSYFYEVGEEDNINFTPKEIIPIQTMNDYGRAKLRRSMGAESNLSEATLKRLRRTYDTYEDTNQHTANYLLLATFFGTDAEKDEVKKIMKRRDRRGYLTQEESDWMYKNINPYYDHLRNVKATETFDAESCVLCETPDWYYVGGLCSDSGEMKCIGCCSCDDCHNRWSQLEVGEMQGAETFEASGLMIPLQKTKDGSHYYNCPYCKKELTVMSYQGSHVALCENESKCNGLEIPREYLGDFEEWNWYHNEGGAFQSETFEAREKYIQGIRIVKNPNFPSGTSLQAYLKTNRAELRKIFGNPNYGGMRGKNNEYNLILNGKVVTIYDYKEEGKRGTKYFNIGSKTPMGAVYLADIISAHRGEKVSAKETTPKWNEEERRFEKADSIDDYPDVTFQKALDYENRMRMRYRSESFESEDDEGRDPRTDSVSVVPYSDEFFGIADILGKRAGLYNLLMNHSSEYDNSITYDMIMKDLENPQMKHILDLPIKVVDNLVFVDEGYAHPLTVEWYGIEPTTYDEYFVKEIKITDDEEASDLIGDKAIYLVLQKGDDNALTYADLKDFINENFDGTLYAWAESFEASGTKKPKLTPAQLRMLNHLRYSLKVSQQHSPSIPYAYFHIKRDYYERTSRNQAKHLNALLDKGLINIKSPSNPNERFEIGGAYEITLNPMADEYKYKPPSWAKNAESFEASEKQGVCDTCGRKRWWFENKRGEISGQVCGYGYTLENAKTAHETGIPADFCRGMVHNPFIKNAESFEAKGIDTFAKPFEEIGIPKTYARLGVITAGITALAFGVMKLKDR